jgi:hypothetical protein
MNRTKIFSNKSLFLIAVLAIGFAVFSGCSDPRSEPPTAPDAAFTETITLWQDTPSNGETITANFRVDRPLAPILHPGTDAPARLTVTAFIEPDADILWRERIISDSIPFWSDPNTGLLIYYQIQRSVPESVLDSVAGIRACCDTVPQGTGCCPSDTSGLSAAHAAAQAEFDRWQDSIDIGVADTTRLGMARDSLGIVLDDRFTLALWLDGDTLTVYPEAVYRGDGMTLTGQEIYLATTGQNGFKGRTFRINTAQFAAADANNPTRPIEINWAVCSPAGTRACLSAGEHTLRARVTGAATRITATLVLVYGEEG